VGRSQCPTRYNCPEVSERMRIYKNRGRFVAVAYHKRPRQRKKKGTSSNSFEERGDEVLKSEKTGIVSAQHADILRAAEMGGKENSLGVLRAILQTGRNVE